jgi:hypothetical protein
MIIARDKRYKTDVMSAQDARYVFVRLQYNLWMRTDACVAQVKCLRCESPIGTPCVDPTTGAFRSGTHYKRRYLASGRIKS